MTKQMQAKWLVAGTALLLAVAPLFSAKTGVVQPGSSGSLFGRKYKAGDVLLYYMTGSNHGWEYTIEANAVVEQDEAGVFFEQIGRSNLHSKPAMTMCPASLASRQNHIGEAA
jgi:hypothetical protein